MRSPAPSPHPLRGFTLVELMAGMAIGLAVVSLALGLLGLQLQDTRRQLADIRLTHDLQTIAELVSRDLGRAGHGMPPGTADAALVLPAGGESASVDYATTPASGAAVSRFGYRLRDGVIEMAIGAGHWQALSDATSMRITRLEFVPDGQRIELRDFCSRRCDDEACPYQLQRRVRIRLQAQPQGSGATGRQASREAEVEARVRNDAVVGGCPA